MPASPQHFEITGMIHHDDPGQARLLAWKLLEAAGMVLQETDLPRAAVGVNDQVGGVYLAHATAAYSVVIGVLDVRVDRPDDGGSTDEYCGFDWGIWHRAPPTHRHGSYANDFYHSFGKGRAGAILNEALCQAGIGDFGPVWAAFIELSKRQKCNPDALLARASEIIGKLAFPNPAPRQPCVALRPQAEQGFPSHDKEQ